MFIHLFVYYKLFWIEKSLDILFIVGSFIIIIFILFPIFPFIVVFTKKYKKNIINILKQSTFILLLIVIIIGLILSIVFIINSIKSKTFFKECPFNLTIENLNYIFSEYYGQSHRKKEIKDKCLSRRCILDQENFNEKYPYVYLCNYDPTEEFDQDENTIFKRINQNGEEIIVNDELICSTVYPNYNIIKFSHNELYLYLDLCYNYANFNRCLRFNKPEKKYNLDLKVECPENNYLLLVYILCILIVLMDLIISLLPWGIEYITFKKILIILSSTRRKTNSNNSTEKSSEISQEEPEFKKEKTPILIIEKEIQVNNLNLNPNIENDDDLVLKLKKKIKINEIKLHDNVHEDIKENYNSNDANSIKNTERNQLNKNIEIDVNSEDKDVVDNCNNIDLKHRNKAMTKHLQSTTLISYINKPLEIKIDNKNSEEN